jgi:hypothetical protein
MWGVPERCASTHTTALSRKSTRAYIGYVSIIGFLREAALNSRIEKKSGWPGNAHDNATGILSETESKRVLDGGAAVPSKTGAGLDQPRARGGPAPSRHAATHPPDSASSPHTTAYLPPLPTPMLSLVHPTRHQQGP